MVKPELGVKRTCPSCGARFYDLRRSPAECPKCEHSFDPEVLLKPRRTRPEAAVVKKEVAAEPELEEAEEGEELEEAEEGEEEEGAAIVLETEELEEEAEGEPATARKGEPAHEQDGLVEVEDDDEEEGEEEDEIVIAEIEDDEDDVTDIVDTDIEKEDR